MKTSISQMRPWIAGFLLLSLSAGLSLTKVQAQAATDVTPTLSAMLTDYRTYAEKQWHADTKHAGLGYWGSGKANGGNEGIRAIATTALTYALLENRGDTTFSTGARLGPALLYAANTHLTGTITGTDNVQWGNSWQSAMWAANLGVAAWLVRDTLDAATLTAVKRVVAYEADRFIGASPPTMTTGDTKAEENAWDLTAPAAALLLMPTNAHAAGWQDAVIKYGYNTLSVASDATSTLPADEGKTVRDWVSTTQLYPDFTLENHGIFHPVYTMIGPATNAQAAVSYMLGGQPIPRAVVFNILKGWGMLQYIALADGEWLYPQGLDWDLHDYEHLHYWTELATMFQDPAAALLEQRTIGYARRRQLINGDGSFVGPSGSLGYARESVQAERVAFSLLMHMLFGSPPVSSAVNWDTLKQQLPAAQSFPWVGMAIHRSTRGIFSFSWKNHLMAQVVPQSETHLDQPYVTTPSYETLMGGFTLLGQTTTDAAKFAITSQSVQTSTNGLTALVDATINNASLRQQISVASLAPGIVAYVDRVTALKAVSVTEERGLLLSIENDNVSGNVRHIMSASGTLTATGGQLHDYALTGKWANVDDRLGLVSALGNPILYRMVTNANRAGAREDYLLGSYYTGTRAFATGAIVSQRAGLLLLDSPSAETASLASSAAVDTSGGNLVLRYVTPDGQAHRLSLNGAVPMATTTISGTVSLQGRTNMAQPLTFTLSPAGTTTGAVLTQTIIPDASGAYSIPNVAAGTYTIGIKGSVWLRKSVGADTTAGDTIVPSVTLLTGDLNNDNQVNGTDLSLMRHAYGSVPSKTNWSAAADLNGDGQVSMLDLSLLRANYGRNGN